MEANWDDPEFVRGRARRKTIWLVGIVLHVALFALLIGWPYVRGEMRGRDSRRAFGAFAACFYGGEATGEAGLALPEGDRLAYASHYLSAEPDWPERCRPLLSRLIDGEPFLLYPGVKGAEARVREAAALADRELEVLSTERRDEARRGSVPLEPLEAVGVVAGSLADLAREIDPRTPIEEEVITLDAVRLPEPARVPLTTASDAVIDVEPLADGVRVRAVDARGLSRTRSMAGRSRAGRIRRPGTVRAMIDGPDDDPILVHATNPSRCPDDPHRCARRSTGLSRWTFGEGASVAIWLSGHPRGRIDRSLRVGVRDAWMVAVADDGEGAELRWFRLPAEPEREMGPAEEPVADDGEDAGAGDETPTMLAPELRVPLEGVTAADDVLLAGDRVLYSTTDAQGETRYWSRLTAGGDASLIAELSGGAPFVLSCDDARFSAFGTTSAVVVVEDGEGGPRVGHRHDFSLGAPALDGRRPSRDRARLVCDDLGATLALHHVEGHLQVLTCARAGACRGAIPIAAAAAGFGFARSEGATLIAWTEDEQGGAIRARTLGEPAIATRVIGACFEGGEGFCGVPRVAVRNARFLVVAQEGADLRVLETVDAGATFAGMSGVR